DTIIATADTIIVDKENDIFILNGNAIYYSPSDSATASQIYFDRQKDSIALVKDAYYVGKDNRATGDTISYNKSTESISVAGKSIIQDAGTTLQGDQVKYDKKTKAGYATGNVIYIDTVENIQLWADTLDFNGDINYIKATSIDGKKPVYASNQDGDTLYISGKVLNSYQKIVSRLIYTAFDSISATKIDSNIYYNPNLD
ncbi:MAG TPA: LptA/OstA family protein, partial [Saprospiraceae bacterium]|nr:LptA/OstA family protein [Saprospiraceae bacterium]